MKIQVRLKKMIPSFFIVTLMLLFSLQANSYTVNNQNSNTSDDEWTLLKKVSDISVYYKISECETQINVTDPSNFDPAHALDNHQLFQLKFVNDNTTSKSINFSKITTTDGSDEMQTISINTGTTIIESCETTAKLILTKTAGDNYPISVNEYLEEFKFTINN